MNRSKILQRIKTIEQELLMLKTDLSAPKDIKITAINRDGVSAVEVWTKDLPPRLIAHKDEEVSNEIMKAWMLEACDYLPLTCAPEFIEIESDLEQKFFPPFLLAILDAVKLGTGDWSLIYKASLDAFIRIVESHGFNNNLQECKPI